MTNQEYQELSQKKLEQEALELARNELNTNKRTVRSITRKPTESTKNDGSPTLSKKHRKTLKMMNNNFLNNNVDQIKGLDPKYLNDDLNYQPNTEYSV